MFDCVFEYGFDIRRLMYVYESNASRKTFFFFKTIRRHNETDFYNRWLRLKYVFYCQNVSMQISINSFTTEVSII